MAETLINQLHDITLLNATIYSLCLLLRLTILIIKLITKLHIKMTYNHIMCNHTLLLLNPLKIISLSQ